MVCLYEKLRVSVPRKKKYKPHTIATTEEEEEKKGETKQKKLRNNTHAQT